MAVPMTPLPIPLRTRLWRWLIAEPFVHFVVLGALIFAAYALWGTATGSAARRIEVTRADQERLRALATQQWGKPPDAAQMASLIDNHVREEVLYREALAAGLERDDVIVRRRLAQKMEFLLSAEAPQPSQVQLRDYFASHSQQFANPAVIDFEALYFNPSQRGDAAQRDAQAALALARKGQVPVGDTFMLGTQFQASSQAQIDRDFGAGFARSVWDLPLNQWSGPLPSAHGLHLVRVRSRHAAQAPDFDQVRERVQAAWQDSAAEPVRQAAYARLRARYQVHVSGSDAP